MQEGTQLCLTQKKKSKQRIIERNEKFMQLGRLKKIQIYSTRVQLKILTKNKNKKIYVKSCAAGIKIIIIKMQIINYQLWWD